MADGTTQRGNDNIATDQLSTLNGVDVSGESKPPKVQRVKLGYGADGVYQDVDENHPLLVDQRPSQITAGQTNGSGDGAGDVVTYTETLYDGTVLNWTDTFNSDGSLHSHVHD